MEESLIFNHSAYDRFKGAEWFQEVLGYPVLLIGSGGINSWVSLLLARCGAELMIYEFDTVEQLNLAGQLFKESQINMNKAEAVKQTIKEFCINSTVETFKEKYVESSPTHNVVIMGVDNMEARKVGFTNWYNYVKEHPEERCLFIDGRLSASLLQIFCLTSDNIENIEKYKEHFLPSDEEVPEESCTNKQTSFCAAMIASHMVAFFTNWMNPLKLPNSVPFRYEYLIPINWTENEN